MKRTILALKACAIGIVVMILHWSPVSGYSAYLGFLVVNGDPEMASMAKRRQRKLWEQEVRGYLDHPELAEASAEHATETREIRA